MFFLFFYSQSSSFGDFLFTVSDAGMHAVLMAEGVPLRRLVMAGCCRWLGWFCLLPTDLSAPQLWHVTAVPSAGQVQVQVHDSSVCPFTIDQPPYVSTCPHRAICFVAEHAHDVWHGSIRRRNKGRDNMRVLPMSIPGPRQLKGPVPCMPPVDRPLYLLTLAAFMSAVGFIG